MNFSEELLLKEKKEEHHDEEKNDVEKEIELKDQFLDKKFIALLETFKKEIALSTKGVIDRVNLDKTSKLEYCCMLTFNIFFFLFLFPILYGFFTIEPNEMVIVEVLGKPIKVMSKPGLNWFFPIATKFRKVSRALKTVELKGNSVLEKEGSPLYVSVVITYSINNALYSTYNVQDETQYLHSQALEVVRRVVAQFKYRSNDPKETTLLKDSLIIGKFMKELINIKMETAGIIVTRMELMEIGYHTEIAQAMLQKQQAQAKVEARKEIVEGGVTIVKEALDSLLEKGVEMTPENKQEFVKSLMLVVCSDVGRAQPVVNI
jgi:hypothetical protein